MKCHFCEADAQYYTSGSHNPVCFNCAIELIADYKEKNYGKLLPTDKWETYFKPIKTEETND